jgi:hypothetical protein
LGGGIISESGGDMPRNLHAGSSEYVQNSAQALDCLLNRWPTDRGMYFETAKVKCDGAIRRIIAGEDARDSFISAAIDARIRAY